MAKKKVSASRDADQIETSESARTVSDTASSGLMPAVPSGSIATDSLVPAGLFSSTQALEADVSGELAGLAPTFGDVLMSIGNGVASSQDALDRGLVDTARALSQTQITVVTDVIQELDDDGLPVASSTELIENELSLINFVTPTVHEWSHVALSMDLSVGALDNESGITFDKTQTTTFNAGGSFLGIIGFGLNSTRERSTLITASASRETDWARGQVRMDAMLRPRNIENFPPPAEVTIGPQIYFAQGTVSETVDGGVVTARSMELTITVRKADGSANPNQIIELDSGPFGHSFETTGAFNGNTTNADGQIRAILTRNIPNPRFLRSQPARVTATLGQIDKQVDIRL